MVGALFIANSENKLTDLIRVLEERKIEIFTAREVQDLVGAETRETSAMLNSMARENEGIEVVGRLPPNVYRLEDSDKNLDDYRMKQEPAYRKALRTIKELDSVDERSLGKLCNSYINAKDTPQVLERQGEIMEHLKKDRKIEYSETEGEYRWNGP